MLIRGLEVLAIEKYDRERKICARKNEKQPEGQNQLETAGFKRKERKVNEKRCKCGRHAILRMCTD